MPGELQVGIEGLRDLGRALTGIQHDLADLGADFGMYDAALGASMVKQQLSEVAGNWKKSRQRISGELQALAKMAEAAAAQYAATESDVSRAFSSGDGGPAGSGSGG